MGQAAHITAASLGGPRFDPTLSAEERNAIGNAIWLCLSCARLIDIDQAKYPAAKLRDWKQRAEDATAQALGTESRFRAIAANEIVSDHSLAEIATFKALELEFGCHIEMELRVPTSKGWIRFQGAVVRDEALIGIDVYEHHGKGIAYFQVEHLLELCSALKFPRFQKCVVYLVVVSDGPEDADSAVQARLEEMLSKSGVEGYVRMFRLNGLRVQFGL